MTGITLDAGALIALDRNDRRVLILIARAIESGIRITVPATALAQAIRNPARQVRLSRLIRQPFTDLIRLDARHATAIGLLLAESGASDIVDADVAVCARSGSPSSPATPATWRVSRPTFASSPSDPATGNLEPNRPTIPVKLVPAAASPVGA